MSLRAVAMTALAALALAGCTTSADRLSPAPRPAVSSPVAQSSTPGDTAHDPLVSLPAGLRAPAGVRSSTVAVERERDGSRVTSMVLLVSPGAGRAAAADVRAQLVAGGWRVEGSVSGRRVARVLEQSAANEVPERVSVLLVARD